MSGRLFEVSDQHEWSSVFEGSDQHEWSSIRGK